MKVKTGAVQEKTIYAITRLKREQAGPQALKRLWREQWTIENRDHYVRDERPGEER